MAKFNRRQTAVGAVAAVAIAVTGYLIYKTFPHLTEKDDDKSVEDVAEQVKEDVKSDVASVKSLVTEAEKQ